MKKYLYLFAIIFSGVIHSQSSGITYQAVIYNYKAKTQKNNTCGYGC